MQTGVFLYLFFFFFFTRFVHYVSFDEPSHLSKPAGILRSMPRNITLKYQPHKCDLSMFRCSADKI